MIECRLGGMQGLQRLYVLWFWPVGKIQVLSVVGAQLHGQLFACIGIGIINIPVLVTTTHSGVSIAESALRIDVIYTDDAFKRITF